MATTAIFVSVGLFVAGLLVSFFVYVSKFASRFDVLAQRFSDRTEMIASDLRKINKTLEDLAGVNFSIKSLTEKTDDHEHRIRKLEEV